MSTNTRAEVADIAVDWEVVAYCPVCEDEIGDIHVGDDATLVCRECGTAWDIDGRHGERSTDR